MASLRCGGIAVPRRAYHSKLGQFQKHILGYEVRLEILAQRLHCLHACRAAYERTDSPPLENFFDIYLVPCDMILNLDWLPAINLYMDLCNHGRCCCIKT